MALNATLIALSRKTPLLVKALGVVIQVPAAFAFFFFASAGGSVRGIGVGRKCLMKPRSAFDPSRT
jgi:hypothetical protein